MKFNKPCKYIKKISWNTNKLFVDSDKDRVSNIFDCQPHNKRKQDNNDLVGFKGGEGEAQANKDITNITRKQALQDELKDMEWREGHEPAESFGDASFRKMDKIRARLRRFD